MTDSTTGQIPPAVQSLTAAHAFFSCGRPDQNLFEVRSGIPAKDALETASCFLSTIVGQVYEMAQEIDSSEAHSAAYLLEMVKGIVDSVTASMAEAASNVAQPRMEGGAE